MSTPIFRMFFGFLYNFGSFSKLYLRFDKILSYYAESIFKTNRGKGSGGLVVKVSALNQISWVRALIGSWPCFFIWHQHCLVPDSGPESYLYVLQDFFRIRAELNMFKPKQILIDISFMYILATMGVILLVEKSWYLRILLIKLSTGSQHWFKNNDHLSFSNGCHATSLHRSLVLIYSQI
jgi:hypothetical protein